MLKLTPSPNNPKQKGDMCVQVQVRIKMCRSAEAPLVVVVRATCLLADDGRSVLISLIVKDGMF